MDIMNLECMFISCVVGTPATDRKTGLQDTRALSQDLVQVQLVKLAKYACLMTNHRGPLCIGTRPSAVITIFSFSGWMFHYALSGKTRIIVPDYRAGRLPVKQGTE
jgi:hypothetical protein